MREQLPGFWSMSLARIMLHGLKIVNFTGGSEKGEMKPETDDRCAAYPAGHCGHIGIGEHVSPLPQRRTAMRIRVASLLVAMLSVPIAGVSAQSAQAPAKFAHVTHVVVLNDAQESLPAKHGVARLEQVLRSRGIVVSENEADVSRADMVVLAGVAGASGRVAAALGSSAQLPQGPEALSIHRGHYENRQAIVLCGGDGAGLMYAALDVAQRVSWAQAGAQPFALVKDADEKPFLRDRGVVMFTMNRAYFESRLYDAHYWERYFDMLAEDRINQLVLTFGYEDGGYMAPLYPYFFDVEGFPDVKVVGLTVEQQKKNLDSFHAMIRIAAERGIRIKPGIWEHIYRGGGQAGAIAWASDGKKPVPGLVWGLNATNLVPYTVAALDEFYRQFPEIKETQFRMHDESGLLNSEIESFWHEVFHFYAAKHPEIALELRAKGLSKSVIKDAQSQGLNVHLDTKIWMEQMGLPYHPTHINREDQNNARQSYADLLEYPQTYRMNWTLWNGGSQRVLEWSDPEYARRLVRSARLYNGQSLVVTEMEATKMLSEPPDDPPHDFLNDRYKYFDYEFERYWAFYRVFGRLAYNPDASDDVWTQEYTQRFGPAVGPHVMRAVELSSRVLPRIVAAGVPYSMFPTTSGWPEMMHMGSLPSYAAREEGSDIAQFENVRDEAARIIANGDTAMRRPEETSQWFTQTSQDILREVAAAEAGLKGGARGNQLKVALTDAKILAGLARYHAARQLAAVDYNLYKQAGSLPAFDEAIAHEKNALQAWQEMVDAAGDVYIENMYFGSSQRGFPHHWKDELPAMEKEFSALTAERQSATSASGSQIVLPAAHVPALPPAVAILAASGAAQPGADLIVKAQVAAPAGVRWIRLRYRHVNQKEDYQTLPMVMEDGKPGLYEAAIPGAFITPQWDLMYYVETVDADGNGRIDPDLEQETPYIVQAVQH